ncbi:MAG: WXG100 family type VII secretion target [Lachnospiraceae bacterium]|nr:WXG100 family type VII secretion target [Lachnospiraceae bacterium]
MGKSISVSSFEEMARASAKLAEISGTYREIYRQLMQEAQTMGAAWDGADNQAFVEQISGFTEELNAMADKLQTASEALKQQHDNYVARQDDNIAQVRKLIN